MSSAFLFYTGDYWSMCWVVMKSLTRSADGAWWACLACRDISCWLGVRDPLYFTKELACIFYSDEYWRPLGPTEFALVVLACYPAALLEASE